MNKKIILLMSVMLLIGLSVFVSAQSQNSMIVSMDEDDETSIVYNVELELNEGWNLVAGLLSDEQIDSSSEIRKSDIGAIYFYSNMDNKYLLAYPKKSLEFEAYIQPKDNCGDGVCSGTEREYFESWCSAECQGELSEDIMNHLNVIAKERLILKEGEHQPVGPPSFVEHSFETYWDKTGLDGTCESRGYGNMDCVVLHSDLDSKGVFNYNEFINSPNDGNPNNDYFGKAIAISNDYKVYAQIDYTNTPQVYEVSFYELADSTLKLRGEKKVPTFNEQFISQANWVYSEKTGKIKYETSVIKLNQRNLKAGWNFISITPDMINMDLENLRGNCAITKTYVFNPYNNVWNSITLTDDFEPGMVGMGAIVKVSESCVLGKNTDDVNIAILPPQIPTD